MLHHLYSNCCKSTQGPLNLVKIKVIERELQHGRTIYKLWTPHEFSLYRLSHKGSPVFP